MNDPASHLPLPLEAGSNSPNPPGQDGGKPAAAPLYPKPSLSDPAAALVGYAAGVLAVFGGLVFWPLMAVAVGLSAPRARLAGALGLAIGGVVMGLLNSSLGPPPAYEGPDLGIVFGPPFALISLAIGVPLGALLVVRPHVPPRPRKRPSPSDLAIAIGAVVVSITGATGAVDLATPSRASFAIDLPSGWSGRVRTASDAWFDPTYGNHFTSVFGSSEPPPNTGLPRTPVVGVSVIRADYSPRECILDVHGWSSHDVPLYLGTVLSAQDVELPGGSAHRIVRVLTQRSIDPPPSDAAVAGEPPGRLYAWGFTRERQVGILHEDLCYMLVVTIPAGSTIGEGEADAIAASFRFR